MSITWQCMYITIRLGLVQYTVAYIAYKFSQTAYITLYSAYITLCTLSILLYLYTYRATPSAQLSVTQFFQHESNIEFDPPAYIRNLLSENVGSSVQIRLSEDPSEVVTVVNNTGKHFTDTTSNAIFTLPIPIHIPPKINTL